MVIISKTILKEFAGSHPDAAKALSKWYEEVKSADLKNFTALKIRLIRLIMWVMIDMYLILREINTG